MSKSVEEAIGEESTQSKMMSSNLVKRSSNTLTPVSFFDNPDNLSEIG